MGRFRTLLEESLAKRHVDATSREIFSKQSWSFWRNHKLEYWKYPDRYSAILTLYRQAQLVYNNPTPADPERYRSSIELFHRFDVRNTLPKNPILFIGSSSIVFWETAVDFPDYPVINRGFGGATLAEINYYFDDVVEKYQPRTVILFCDVDIEINRSPEDALQAFMRLASRISNDLPATQVLLLSMKPTLMDDFLGSKVRENKLTANRLFKAFSEGTDNIRFVDVATAMMQPDGRVRPDIFLPDGMHLNAEGYALWTPIIRAHLGRPRD